MDVNCASGEIERQYELCTKECQQNFFFHVNRIHDRGLFYDLTLCGDKDIDPDEPSVNAHRIIVAAFSKKFCEYLAGEDKSLDPHLTKIRDRQSRPERTIITFHGFTMCTVRLLVDLMYRKSVKVSLTQAEKDDLFRLVKLLEMNNFEKELTPQLVSFDERDSTSFYKMFENPNNLKIKSVAKMFSKLNKDFTSIYPTFRNSLMSESEDTVMNLMNSPTPYKLKDDWLCEIIHDWVKFSPQERGNSTKKLLGNINFQKVSMNMCSRLKESRNDFGEGKIFLLEWLVQSYNHMSSKMPQACKTPITSSNELCVLFGGLNEKLQQRTDIAIFDLKKQKFIEQANCDIPKKNFNFDSFKCSYIKSTMVVTPKILFLIGGVINSNTTSSCRRYMLDTQKWTDGPNLKIKRSKNASLCIGDQIYTLGGLAGYSKVAQNLQSMEVLNFRNQNNMQWTLCEGSNYGVHGHSLCPFEDGFLCIGGMGGAESEEYFNTVMFYSTQSNTWTPFPSMKYSRYYPLTSNVKGDVYVFGGCNADTVLKTCERFNSSSNQWECLLQSMIPIFKGVSCTFEDKYIFCFGGKSSKEAGNSNVLVPRYDLKTGKWCVIPFKMPHSCIDGHIYRVPL